MNPGSLVDPVGLAYGSLTRHQQDLIQDILFQNTGQNKVGKKDQEQTE